MAARLLLPLALLAAVALGWLLLGSEDAQEPDVLPTEEGDGEAGHVPSMTAKGRPGSSERKAPEPIAPAPAVVAIGQPRPDQVRKPLRARVRGREGRAIAGARVTVYDRAGGMKEHVTRKDGSFEFEGVPGRYRLRIDAGRDGLAWVSNVVLDGNASAEPTSLALEEAATLGVLLRTPEAPAAGVTVQVRAPDLEGMPPQEARSDALGRVRFEHLVPARYEVRVTSEDGALHTREVELAAGEDADLDMLLVATRPVAGTVRRGGLDGPGVSEAEIRFVIRAGARGQRVERDWKTNYAGAFHVDLPRGDIEVIRVRAEGHAPRWIEQASLPRSFLKAFASKAPEPAALELVLGAGRALHGTVRTAAGEPVGDLELALHWAVHPTGGDDLEIARTRTAEDGTYRFEHCPAAVLQLRLVSTRFGTVDRGTVVLGKDGDVERNLVVRPASHLQGIVSGVREPAVAGARVWINSGDGPVRGSDGALLETYTDERGWWRISGVPSGRSYRVRASHGDLVSPPHVISASAPPPSAITLRLAGAGTVRGRLLDAVLGEALGGVRVRLVREDPRDALVRDVYSDADGAFEATGLVPGTWVLLCAVPHRLPLRKAFDIVDATAVAFELSLEEGTVFEGTVKDASGTPVAGASVTVRAQVSSSGDRPAQVVTTDRAGRFRLGGYPNGRYVVSAWVEGTSRRAEQRVDGGNTSIRLTLK